jgi:hypothetical protein
VLWAVAGGLIGLILFLIWHFAANRRQGVRLSNYGVTGQKNTLEWTMIGKSILFALVVLAAIYAALAFLNFAFRTDARIWVFNAKVITPDHLPIILAYLIPFTLYFLMLSIILHGELRSTRLSMGREIVKNIVIMVIGFIGLLLIEYVPLLSGTTLGGNLPVLFTQPLISIIAYQFVPVYIIIASVSTYFFYKTGRIYAGSFINALFITALIVTSTATQFPVLGR